MYDFIIYINNLVDTCSLRMSARDGLNHKWLRADDIQSLPPKSPFGSPIGCRRALTPSPDGFLDSEPLKRCKCATDSSGDELQREDSEPDSTGDEPVETGSDLGPSDIVNGNALVVDSEKENKCNNNTMQKGFVTVLDNCAKDRDQSNAPMKSSPSEKPLQSQEGLKKESRRHSKDH